MPNVLVAALGVAASTHTMLRRGVATTLAVLGFPGGMALVFVALVPLLLGSRVVGSVPRADGHVVFAAAVGAHDVLRRFDFNLFQWLRVGFPDLCMEAIMPALQWYPWGVVLYWNQSDGADIETGEAFVAA